MNRIALFRWIVGGFVLTALPLLSASRSESGWKAEVSELLRSIQLVAKEGEGNVAASRAWRQLSQMNAAVLPRILASIDEEEPLPANWMCSLVDSIAERVLRSGAKLPQTELEAFVKDTRQSPRARRLAFEWLARVDASAPDRLIPAMLHDPGVDFRRDAVDRLLSAAKAHDEAKRQAEAAAIAVYNEALSGARDEDQIQQIVTRLRDYGQEVNLPRHFGFLMRWKVIGPFDNVEKRGFDRPFPPEQEINLDVEYDGKSGKVRWIDYTSEDEYGLVDLNAGIAEEKGVVAYALHEFVSHKEQEVELRVGTKNAWKLWVNGELAYTRDEYHHGTKLDHYRARSRLKKGRNQILLKVCQNDLIANWTKVWRFQIRVCDSAGTAILSQIRGGKQETSAVKPRAQIELKGDE